jgi:hypothetical protein
MDQKNNSGALYRNKKDKPTSPDYTGNVVIDGKKYRLAGWLNKSKAGANYLRLLLSEEQPKPNEIVEAIQEKREEAINNNPQTDDLPF